MNELTSNQNNEPEKQKENAQENSSLLPGYYLQLGSIPDEVNLLELWEGITSRKRLIILITTLFTCLGILLAVILPKKYLGEVVMAEAEYGDQTITSKETGEDIPELTVEISANEALAMLKSRIFLYKFFQDNEMLPILFENKWDNDQGKWKDDLKKFLFIKDDIPTLWDAHDKFTDDILDVITDDETNLYTVTVKWTDPKLSAEWANRLVDLINANLQQRAIEEANKIIEQLNTQLQKTSVVVLQLALYDLMTVQMAKIVSAKVHKEYAFKIIDLPFSGFVHLPFVAIPHD